MSGQNTKKLEVWENVAAAKAAIFFKVSQRTLSEWVSRGCPKNSYGKFNLKDVREWRGKATTSQSAEARKADSEARYRESKAKMAELQTAEKEGKLISKEEVIWEWSLRVSNVKKSLTLLPKKIAALFPDRRNRQMVEKAVGEVVRNALDQYARKGDYTPEEKEFEEIILRENIEINQPGQSTSD